MRHRLCALAALLCAGIVPVPPPAAADVSIPSRDAVLLRLPDVRLSELPALDTFVTERRTHGAMPIPHALEVPSGKGTAATEPSPGPAPEPLADPAPLPELSFAALEDNNSAIPPDTNGAAGPNHLMITLNTGVRVQDRAGTTLSTVSLSSFFGASGSFDPRIVYDALSGRWVATAVAGARSSSSVILFAVSTTSDPTGTWHRFYSPASTGTTWGDYPTLGVNKNWIVVQVNLFNVSPCCGFNHSEVYTLDKAALYAGTGAGKVFVLAQSFGGTQYPALTMDASQEAMYLLQDWNGNAAGQGHVRLYSISGTVANPSMSQGTLVSVPATWDHFPAGGLDFAPQLGTTQRIQTNDSRMHNVVVRNGSVWAAQAVFLPTGGPSRSSVQWWNISTGAGVLQRGRIDDTGGQVFYAYPSLAVNRGNDVLVGYSRFTAGTYAAAGYSYRRAGDPSGTMRADTVFKAGEAPYAKFFSGTRNRWGDYSMTVVDPTNDSDMWTIQEYASLPAGGFDRWGTWWAKIPGPGLIVTPSLATTQVTEDGATDTYTVELKVPPTASVTVTPVVDGQLHVSPSSLTFSASNWNVPQTVTVGAVDDAIAEPTPHTATVSHQLTSADSGYNAFTGYPIEVAITDNDVAGITLTESGGSTAVVEGGATDNYALVLHTQPVAPVTITPTPDAQLSTTPTAVTFSTTNWSTPQTITVRAVDDAVDEPDTHTGVLTHTITTTDPMYAALTLPPVTAVVTDNDTAGIVLTESGGSTKVAEGGATDTYTIVLRSQPTATVTITASPGPDVAVSPISAAFTVSNWNAPRTFTVSAVNDTIDEDPVEIDHITHTVSTTDALYAALPVPTVVVEVTDDDPVVRLTQTDGSTHVSEFGTTDTFTIVLEGPPAAPLQINLVTDEGQVTTSPSSVTFDSTNFSTPRVVTVSAVDDEVDEVSPHYDVVRTVAPGTGPRSVLVEIDDNDPEVAGSAQAANPLGRTSGATEALFRAQCLTGGIIVGQGLDGYVIGMPRPDPEGLLVPTGPNAGSADFDVYFYDQGCNRLSSGDFAEAGPGRNELGRIPASARWAVVNYIAGSGPGSFTFRY